MDQYILFKNANIFYRTMGKGKPVVLIHGFGEDGNVWNDIAAELKNNFLVIIPDLPGSGKSSLINIEDEQVSIDDYGEVIANIIKNELPDKCVVIGHSMGGYIALSVAEKHPGMLNGFGFVNSTAYADTEEKKKDRLRSIDFIKKNGAFAFLKASIGALFGDKFKKDHTAEIENFISSVNYFKEEALIQYYTAMINRRERINILQTTPLPVIFIIGEKDPAIPLEKSLAQCHLPNISYVHILPEAGHMSMLEEKEMCAKMILSYLDMF